MHEIEVKILDIDRKVVESKLLGLGATFVGEEEQFAQYFESSPGETIRLRREGDKVVFCVKKKIHHDGAKVAEEHEVEVSGFDDMVTILEFLGCKRAHTVSKKRRKYRLGEVCFDIDKHHRVDPVIPEYLEIEAPSIELCHEFAEKLGFSKEDCKPWTGKDLIKHYREF